VSPIAGLVAPVADLVSPVADLVTPVARLVEPVARLVPRVSGPVLDGVTTAVAPLVRPVATVLGSAVAPFTPAVGQLVASLEPVVALVEPTIAETVGAVSGLPGVGPALRGPLGQPSGSGTGEANRAAAVAPAAGGPPAPGAPSPIGMVEGNRPERLESGSDRSRAPGDAATRDTAGPSSSVHASRNGGPAPDLFDAPAAGGAEAALRVSASPVPPEAPGGGSGLPIPPAPAGGGASASGGSGGASNTLVGLLAALVSFCAQRFSRRLQLPSAPWRPARFVAVIERPG
jgi:hypothetical protein